MCIGLCGKRNQMSGKDANAIKSKIAQKSKELKEAKTKEAKLSIENSIHKLTNELTKVLEAQGLGGQYRNAPVDPNLVTPIGKELKTKKPLPPETQKELQIKFRLEPTKFNLGKQEEPKKLEDSSCIGHSTPVSSRKELFKKEEKSPIILDSKEPVLSPVEVLNTVKQKLKEKVKEEVIEEYFSIRENVDDLHESIKDGNAVWELVCGIARKLNPFSGEDATIAEVEENNAEQILKSEESLNETDNEVEMANNGLHMRGLSLKDALDLIPRYNGQNIPLNQFLEGCTEAKSILSANMEPEFAKLVRIRLYGEALSSIRGQTFENIRQITEFLEKIFGSAKTYHEWTGDLAKVKQRPSESVISYLNRIREIENEIVKAAIREDRVENEETLRSEVE